MTMFPQAPGGPEHARSPHRTRGGAEDSDAHGTTRAFSTGRAGVVAWELESDARRVCKLEVGFPICTESASLDT